MSLLPLSGTNYLPTVVEYKKKCYSAFLSDISNRNCDLSSVEVAFESNWLFSPFLN